MPIARPAGVTNGGTGLSSSAGASHVDLVPEPAQRPGQVHHVRLDTAGHVERVRADDADLHAGPIPVRPCPRATAFWVMCQSGGPGRDVAREHVGQRLRRGGDACLVGHADRRVDPETQPSSVNQLPTGSSAAPVRAASSAGRRASWPARRRT